MIYGYARASTFRQGVDGNSLQDQHDKLTAARAQEIVTDVYTGTKMDRPNFTVLMERLQEGDTLVVTKLDRFARTATEGAALVQALMKRGVVVNVLNMGRADDTPIGHLMVTIMLAFAEYERDMIVERTQTGKAIARNAGKRVDGRPKKFSAEQMRLAMELLGEHSYSEVERMTGISKSTLIRARRVEQLCPTHPE